jgi:hypothetical protein
LVSLVDIVPQTRTVQIAAGGLELRGLGLRQIADLFLTFPTLRNMYVAGAPEVTAAELIMQAPDAVGTIIAEAAGQPEAVAAIAAGNALSMDEEIDCLEVIRDLTFPRGVDPLLKRLAALLAGHPSGRVPAMSAQPLPNGSLPMDMPAPK